MKYMEEQYFICKNCGNLTTYSEMIEACGNGGSADCYCDYMIHQWDDVTGTFEPVYFREFNSYTEIPERVYNGLIKEPNTLLRLRMLGTVGGHHENSTA